MMDLEPQPSAGALEEVRLLAGTSASIDGVRRLEGGQHADTWEVSTVAPPTTVVVREFPPGDPGAEREADVLEMLGGLGGLAPALLGTDLTGRWSERPTSLIGRLDGEPDITPADPRMWACELGRALAVVHRFSSERLASLPRAFDRNGASSAALAGPLARSVRAGWDRVEDGEDVLAHDDYWSGNVVWRNGRIAGIVDWSGAARGPRGFDVSWCRLDLVLLFGEEVADTFLGAYEVDCGQPLREVLLWDMYAAARSHRAVGTWAPNYAPLGRSDLDPEKLRHLHSQWTSTLAARER